MNAKSRFVEEYHVISCRRPAIMELELVLPGGDRRDLRAESVFCVFQSCLWLLHFCLLAYFRTLFYHYLTWQIINASLHQN